MVIVWPAESVVVMDSALETVVSPVLDDDDDEDVEVDDPVKVTISRVEEDCEVDEETVELSTPDDWVVDLSFYQHIPSCILFDLRWYLTRRLALCYGRWARGWSCARTWRRT